MSIYYEPGSEGLTDSTHHLKAALEAVAETARALKKERDEARAMVENQKARIGEFFFALEKLTAERDEAREALAEEMKFHHRTHAELVETQCKLQDALRERNEAREAMEGAK